MSGSIFLIGIHSSKIQWSLMFMLENSGGAKHALEKWKLLVALIYQVQDSNLHLVKCQSPTTLPLAKSDDV